MVGYNLNIAIYPTLAARILSGIEAGGYVVNGLPGEYAAVAFFIADLQYWTIGSSFKPIPGSNFPYGFDVEPDVDL